MKKALVGTLSCFVALTMLTSCSTKVDHKSKSKSIPKHSETSTTTSDKVIQSEQKVTQFTHEELAMAVYVDNYVDNHKDITSTIDSINSNQNLTMSEENNLFTISQGTYSSQQNISIVDTEIVCTIHSGKDNSVEKKLEVKSINEKYEKYHDQIQNMIAIGKNNNEKLAKNSIDTKNLSTEQAITWVKNYLIQQGANNDEFDEVIFKTQMSSEGYLEICIYTWNLAKTAQTLSSIYRISSDGKLEQGSTSSSDTWSVVSDSYIQ
ncbi:hypothetical protein [Vagococcus carniphilus]|nr:hypothetical protein [Vagococcus carniphilus]MDT2841026.1 hypothetical protein [Vagococcus carniphilus]